MKMAFDGFQSCSAAIDILPMGLCPVGNQHFAVKSAGHQRSAACPIDFRIGVPTLNPTMNCLLATPPSLTWAFAVATAFYRLQAGHRKADDCDSNLTVETVGVLQNWVDFMLYGTLLKDDSDKYEFIHKDLVSSVNSLLGPDLLSTLTSMSARISSVPA